jgi:hypothetical protein
LATYLSMLKAPATMNKLRDLQSQALEPQKIAAFIHVVANDLAYSLFVAVERAKVQLSERDAALFAFADPPLAIEKTASRRSLSTGSTVNVTRSRDASTG